MWTKRPTTIKCGDLLGTGDVICCKGRTEMSLQRLNGGCVFIQEFRPAVKPKCSLIDTKNPDKVPCTLYTVYFCVRRYETHQSM